MSAPGDRRPTPAAPPGPGAGRRVRRLRPRSAARASAEAVLIGLLGAIAWALLKGVLEFPGVLAVAVVAGWAMGNSLRQLPAAPLVASLMACAAWALGLVLTWTVAMAILPGSSRTFVERLEATPFFGWLGPQFGLIEGAGLALYVLAAVWGARTRPGAAT